MRIEVNSVSKIVQGHVLDVARGPLVAALRRYDPLLYIKWNPKKRSGLGLWELRRRPEFKSAQRGRLLETPHRGKVFIPGDIFDLDEGTLIVPRYIENSFENHVKDFQRLDYGILNWVAKQDLWKFGYKGKNAMNEADYREGQYLTKIEDDAEAERAYMIKQHRTQFNDYRQYILSGGNPARLVDYWD